ATGAKLVVASRNDRKDLVALSLLIKQQKVSHTLCLPSLYELILEYVDPTFFKTLTTVIVAGESCSRELCIKHNRKNSDCVLYNEYGPTEASVWCSVYKVPKTNLPFHIPIGAPIPGTQILVLDSRRRPVPNQVAGEIHICGPGVVPGYINGNGKLDDRFWVSTDETECRYYATGDLAFSDQRGRLTFLGRRDEQVKVRGHRIELGEVESAIKSESGITDAAVSLETPVSHDIDQLLAATAMLEPAALDKLLAEAEKRI
ncbi:MAG: AMP-binding protein, partial [Verrucomicrobiales bacterium]|nr:AMP-binding protein [Verrucomicrobiales bacterium]